MDFIVKICAANPDLRIERNAAGQLEIMSPSGSHASAVEVKFVAALDAWNDRNGSGIVFGASGGFRLPNGAIRAGDAAWVRLADWNALTIEEQRTFAPVTPAFVVEVRSPSDSLPALREKVREWIRNGCRLAWLIDPLGGAATIYRSDGSSEHRRTDIVLSGEDVLPGFSFDLKSLP